MLVSSSFVFFSLYSLILCVVLCSRVFFVCFKFFITVLLHPLLALADFFFVSFSTFSTPTLALVHISVSSRNRKEKVSKGIKWKRKIQMVLIHWKSQVVQYKTSFSLLKTIPSNKNNRILKVITAPKTQINNERKVKCAFS